MKKIKSLLVYENFALVPLSKGYFAKIDLDDVEKVSQYNWCVYIDKTTNYAIRANYTKNGRLESLHNFIMNPPEGMRVDHINHDGLDCRKSEMRVVTRQQNCWNRNLNKGRRYKGPSFNKNAKERKWISQIRVNNKTIWLGSFYTEIEAAKAYDRAAKQYFGEFAKTNFGD